MNDYCAKESTLDAGSPLFIKEDDIRSSTIKMDVQETFKILCEMNIALQEFAQIINGQQQEEKIKKDASCLSEETQMMTALAYENLKRLLEIRDSVI